jgi:hypothetical protein
MHLAVINYESYNSTLLVMFIFGGRSRGSKGQLKAARTGRRIRSHFKGSSIADCETTIKKFESAEFQPLTSF